MYIAVSLRFIDHQVGVTPHRPCLSFTSRGNAVGGVPCNSARHIDMYTRMHFMPLVSQLPFPAVEEHAHGSAHTCWGTFHTGYIYLLRVYQAASYLSAQRN